MLSGIPDQSEGAVADGALKKIYGWKPAK